MLPGFILAACHYNNHWNLTFFYEHITQRAHLNTCKYDEEMMCNLKWRWSVSRGENSQKYQSQCWISGNEKKDRRIKEEERKKREGKEREGGEGKRKKKGTENKYQE